MARRRHGAARLNPQLPQRSHDVAERQAHHVRKAVIEALGGMEAAVLNGIRAGFVEGIAAGNVGFDLCVGIVAHAHIAASQIGDRPIGAGIDQGNPGIHLVCAIPQALQRRARLAGIARLAQWFTVQRNDCVRSEKDEILRIIVRDVCRRARRKGGCSCQHGARFCQAQAQRQRIRALAGQGGFIDVGGGCFHRQAEQLDQFAAARRGRGEQDTGFDAVIWMCYHRCNLWIH